MSPVAAAKPARNAAPLPQFCRCGSRRTRGSASRQFGHLLARGILRAIVNDDNLLEVHSRGQHALEERDHGAFFIVNGDDDSDLHHSMLLVFGEGVKA